MFAGRCGKSELSCNINNLDLSGFLEVAADHMHLGVIEREVVAFKVEPVCEKAEGLPL